MSQLEDRHDDRLEDDDDRPEHLWQSREVRWSSVSGVLLGVGFVAEQLGAEGWWLTTLFVASTLAGVRFFALEALEELWRERDPGSAVGGQTVGSFWGCELG